MRISIISLFPQVFEPFLETSILSKAQEEGNLKVDLVDLREFGIGSHKQVDDRIYGGGVGMVLRVDVVSSAIEKVKKKGSKTILLTPQGEKFSQKKATSFCKEKHLILVCGKYEGVDERVRELVDEEVSIGDYILSGGEIPALVVLDAVSRLIPGVLDKEATYKESLTENLLEAPQFTRPEEYKGMRVPKILLSGDHKKVREWRERKSLEKTKERRPDLLK